MEKKCTGPCGEVKPLSEFSRDRSKTDGRCVHCKVCRSAYAKTPRGREVSRKYAESPQGREVRRKYRQSPEGREVKRKYNHSTGGRFARKLYAQSPMGKHAQQTADGNYKSSRPDRRLAHNEVNRAVKAGKLLKASTQPCADCGRPAKHYHHESYAKDRWLDVTPLCQRCHIARHAGQQ